MAVSKAHIANVKQTEQQTKSAQLKAQPGQKAKSARSIKLYLDTSTPTTIIKINEQKYKWQSERDLAENLLSYLRDRLAEHNASWEDIGEIEFYAGPGSFTGLRIGAAVVNALADQLEIPLYNHRREKVPIIIPEYGREANISQPKK